jgi:hypothetical protein
MTTTEQLRDPRTIAGYTYGTDDSARSPLTMRELDKLKQAVDLTDEDARYLRMAGEVLSDHAAEMVDTWRELIARHPHLSIYSARPDGTPNPDYGQATHPRFARWIIDVCTRPYDQDFLDYQHEIGLRHTRQRKNKTDDVESADHIPLRYVLAFAAPVIVSTREFLQRGGHSADDVERMHAAWTKAVILHVTLWSRAYLGEPDW